MQITCPQCRNDFIVAVENINPEGQRLRCSYCQHIWRHRQDLSDDSDQVVSRIIEEKGDGGKGYFKLFSVVLILIAAMIAYQRSKNALEISSSRFIAGQMSVEKFTDKIVIACLVRNGDSEMHTLPPCKVTLIDARGEIIAMHQIVDSRQLQPRQMIRLTVTFGAKQLAASKVAIYLDSQLALLNSC